MASDLATKLGQLKALSEDIHWFCPRVGPDDPSYYYDEDLGQQLETETEEDRRKRLKKIDEVNDRKELVFQCFQVLAFDGPDAAQYKEWIKDRLKTFMTACDVCIRIFHRS